MTRVRPARDEQGVTLFELLITLLLFGIVIAVAGPSLLSGINVLNHTDDDTQGLADIRMFVERMSRDLRAASKVYSSSDTSRLEIWIDYDANYRATDDENITWLLEPHTPGPHYDVVRRTAAGASQIASQTVVNGMTFAYTPPPGAPPPEGPEKTRLVRVSVEYDARPGRDASIKTAGFNIRLRNVQ